MQAVIRVCILSGKPGKMRTLFPVNEFWKSLEKSGEYTKFNRYNVFIFVNLMSLLLQCVNFHGNTVYSFVGPSSMKGVWVHYMDNRTRLDGRGHLILAGT